MKVYGYKTQDLKDLCDFIKGKENIKRRTLFREFAKKSGKAEGTVRNMFYALNKANSEGKVNLDINKFKVAKINSFDKLEEQKLIDAIKKGRSEGKSVRKIINELSDGNIKMALRYQNKYRNLAKKEIDIDRYKNLPQTIELKREIDNLINRINQNNQNERECLKKRNEFLQKENERLTNILLSKNSKKYSYFIKPNDDAIN